jgi:hypothetical protein
MPSNFPSVARMPRIEWPAVEADIETIAVLLDLPLRDQMTIEAERVQLTGPELGNVALVRLNVIADYRRRDDGALQAGGHVPVG